MLLVTYGVLAIALQSGSGRPGSSPSHGIAMCSWCLPQEESVVFFWLRNKRSGKRFFAHTSGSLGESVQGVLHVGHMVAYKWEQAN